MNIDFQLQPDEAGGGNMFFLEERSNALKGSL
jgi:hypothetical protein